MPWTKWQRAFLRMIQLAFNLDVFIVGVEQPTRPRRRFAAHVLMLTARTITVREALDRGVVVHAVSVIGCRSRQHFATHHTSGLGDQLRSLAGLADTSAWYVSASVRSRSQARHPS